MSPLTAAFFLACAAIAVLAYLIGTVVGVLTSYGDRYDDYDD